MIIAGKEVISPNDIFDQTALKRALSRLGDYVYGYYRPKETEPFYVGKGKGGRVLSHWLNSCRNNLKYRQHAEILNILKSNIVPDIKILAYDLQRTKKESVYSVVERILQNTFGIERNINRNVFKSRVKQSPTLVQDRNDGKKYPILSLEAAYCKGHFQEAEIINPRMVAIDMDVPVLLVSLSKSYHSGYTQADLSEMARMYWALGKFKNTTLPKLCKSESAILVGWASEFGGPQIVGIWRIKPRSLRLGIERPNRYMCEVETDIRVRKAFFGKRISGDGKSYRQPHIYLPDSLSGP